MRIDAAGGALVELGSPLPKRRQELFCQRIAAGSSLSDAYRDAGYEAVARNVAAANASRLAALPHVQARVRELTRIAAASASFDIKEHMQALQDIATGDPGELVRAEVEPCPHCWPDEVYVMALEAYMASLSGGPSPLPAPDTSAPRPDCRVGPHVRVIITPTHELSRRASRMLKSIRQKANGEVVIELHDQLQARAQLAELAGWKVNLNANLNANVPAASLPPATPQSVLDAFHALQVAKGST
jgi:hypothetical protein